MKNPLSVLLIAFLMPLGIIQVFGSLSLDGILKLEGPNGDRASLMDSFSEDLPDTLGVSGDPEMEELEELRKQELEDFINTHLDSLDPYSGSDESVQMQKSESIQTMSQSLPNQAEYDALIDLYQATGGVNWYENSGWSTADPNVVESVANWDNIIVDADGHVTHIQLNHKNLTGVLPSTLQNLTYLKWFRVQGNNLTGQLPDFTNMAHLTFVEFSRNNFTGVMPASYGTCPNLAEIHAHQNNIGGSIPSSYTNLTNLKWLSLYMNNMEGSLPSDIGNMSSLEYLHIHTNNFSGTIPSSLENLPALEFIDLSNNSFSGSLPNGIGNMPSLKFLFLHNNGFSGTIPSTLGNTNLLEIMWIYSNHFTGNLPQSMGNLNKLKTLFAQDNELSGSIPNSFGGMAELTALRLYNNSIQGSIPSSLGNLNKVEEIRLQNNLLSGPIPSQLGNIQNLEVLILENNKLSGVIPSSFCSFNSLQLLRLNNNLLDGEIPNCLYDKNIYSFTVNYNHFNFVDLSYAKTKESNFNNYSPQNLKFVDTLYVQQNQTLDLTVDDGNYQGAPSIYRWNKDGTWLHSASPSNKTLNVDCGTSPCEGLYYLQITNPDFPNARLSGNLFYLKTGVQLSRTICMVD
ncbi:hypothetical protein LZF95_23855 [Algoriphagus sp. AGSA1]|uniref:hypothetical protein n=1 Tax=Algoriphagus sp. AGSA1 TaxID=2907213 RepID=UPI001F168FF2|nr:hypothetical protein [Algoriphagus sp. AGSA1]MCE7057739.1 hypothetical protein [Algoriphagus sp. AGSA1]